jgi:hypothetical protein
MNVRYLTAVTALAVGIPIAYANAQDSPEREITLVGCVMHESQYRDMYGPGLSGPRGPGIGVRNEYMLVDAHEVKPGSSNTAEATGPCPPAPGTFPTAYEITGARESDVAAFLGQRVELSGIQKEAKVRPVGTSGNLRPTGGFDPLGHELHLFEVEIASVHLPAVERAAAPPAAAPTPAPAPVAEAPAPEPERVAAAPVQPAAPAPEPERVAAAPPAEPPAPVQQPAAPAAGQPEQAPRQVARAELPRTASQIQMVGLIGLLLLAAAAGLRVITRRS